MNEYFYRGIEEFKRVDHLIFVSLKYTRSVDVIRSCIERLINGYDALMEGLLMKAKDEGKIDKLPVSPGIRCDKVSIFYEDDEVIQDYMDFYMLLRKMYIGKFTRASEFRRGVTMTVIVDKQFMEVNIDIITEYYKRSLEFIEHVKPILPDAPEA